MGHIFVFKLLSNEANMIVNTLRVALSCIILGVIVGTVPAAAQPGGDWSYSEEITIQENSGQTLTDYQVLVELNAAGFDFSKANPDGSDVRFYANSVELSYWIEEWDFGAEEAKVWVKVPSIPANGSAGIEMKYGNPTATSASDGDATFDLFDDFNGSDIDDAKWDGWANRGNGYAEVSDGVGKLVAPDGLEYGNYHILSKRTFPINTMVSARRMKVTTGPDTRGPAQVQGFRDFEAANKVTHATEFSNESWVLWCMAGDSDVYCPSNDWTDVGVPEGSWYESSVAWYEEDGVRKIGWFKNGVRDTGMDYASNTYIPDIPLPAHFASASYGDGSPNTGYMALDYVYVRKFVASEPSIVTSNTPIGSDVTVLLPSAVVTFGNIAASGSTSVITSQGNPGGAMPPNFRVRGQFVDVTTTATYTGPITVCIEYDPSTPNPENLKLFHENGNGWDDVTTYVDTVNNRVCGQVDSLSWFFIGEQWVWVDTTTAPVFPSLYVGIGAAFMAAVSAYVIRRRLILEG